MKNLFLSNMSKSRRQTSTFFPIIWIKIIGDREKIFVCLAFSFKCAFILLLLPPPSCFSSIRYKEYLEGFPPELRSFVHPKPSNNRNRGRNSSKEKSPAHGVSTSFECGCVKVRFLHLSSDFVNMQQE